jgi:hypothetical protein
MLGLLLKQFSITSTNLSYFVLNNTLNNNTMLIELTKTIKFDIKEKRLYYIGYILNLIIEEYLFR